MDRPTPLFIPGMAGELAKIANTTTDADTALRMRRLLGAASASATPDGAESQVPRSESV